nr:immunoglobulin heavy chain junction region [Mus musculus]
CARHDYDVYAMDYW